MHLRFQIAKGWNPEPTADQAINWFYSMCSAVTGSQRRNEALKDLLRIPLADFGSYHNNYGHGFTVIATTTEMNIPNDLIGCVIGKGGAKIK
ncbi:hypothetical protein NPIL_576371 [Nephila pilipes]|uniref:K Homology domain-containing protein n=1 Tax=Nephila pilipes TaxID=299642 RepID=A0A8X6TAN6_NEPPI|nr:hypothetical protein NPIL_576371 [Nephila pilipes]